MELSESKLIAYDRSLGRRFVAGADEAGRGCLAGPIVAAGVLVDYEASSFKWLADVSDSKKHSPQRREQLFELVMKAATKVSVVVRTARSIDSVGLHRTNLQILGVALQRVACDGALCLSDGFEPPPNGLDQRGLVKGDATSAAVAAASIIAKVTRDRFMQAAHEQYPAWRFDEHVGYSTPTHREAIESAGVSPLHRLSFNSVAYAQLQL